MTDNQPRLGPAPYVIAGFSFFPLLGIPFGITAILWGLLSRKKGGRLLAILGTCGILVTIILMAVSIIRDSSNAAASLMT